MGRPKPWSEVTDEEKRRMANCFCTGDCTPMTPDCGGYPCYPYPPPRDDVGDLRVFVQELARAVHLHAGGLMDSLELRTVCVGIVNRLAASGQDPS